MTKQLVKYLCFVSTSKRGGSIPIPIRIWFGCGFNANNEEDVGTQNQPQGDHVPSVVSDVPEMCLLSMDFIKLHNDLQQVIIHLKYQTGKKLGLNWAKLSWSWNGFGSGESRSISLMVHFSEILLCILHVVSMGPVLKCLILKLQNV